MSEENGVVTEGGVSASTESSIPAEVESSSTDVNWSDMALEMDEGAEEGSGNTVEGDVEVVEVSENTDPPQPASTETPTTPAVQAPPVAPVAPTPQAQQPPQAAVQPQTPPQEPPAQPQQLYSDWRAGQISGLEKYYAFDEETSTKLLSEPEVVLPQLAAKLHMEVVEHVMRSVMSAMPQWIDNHSAARTRETDAEQLFYNANPDLKDPAYKNAVLQMGQAYRTMNPNASADEAVRVIGNMVRSALGLLQPQPPVGVAPATTPSVPQVPFTPARGGGGGAAPTPTSNNPWATLAQEFLNES